jgi:hypothetical protein
MLVYADAIVSRLVFQLVLQLFELVVVPSLSLSLYTYTANPGGFLWRNMDPPEDSYDVIGIDRKREPE